MNRSRSPFALRHVAWFVCAGLTGALAACSGSTVYTPPRATSVTASPTPTMPATTSATTVPLVAGNSIAVPSIEGYGGNVVYATAVGTPFPSNATITLQTFVGEPVGGPAPQARRDHALHRFDATPTAIVSILATFNSSVTLMNNNFVLNLPNADSSTTYATETFDERTGQLVAYASEFPIACPTGGCGSNSLFQFFGSTPPYTVTPGVRYLTIVVANPAVTLPSPEPVPSCSGYPAPQVTPSPLSSAESAPQTSTVCDTAITVPSIGSFSGEVSYVPGAFGSIPAGLTATVQSFLGEPSDGPGPQLHRAGRRRFDTEPQTLASLQSTFSANASITDSFEVYLPSANSANTYTAETYDEASGQLLYFVRGGLDPTGSGDYLFGSPGTAYNVTGGAPILTLFVANSAVSPAP